MRQSKPPDRSATIGFRTSPEVKRALRERAHVSGKRLGEWLRELVERALKEAGRAD